MITTSITWNVTDLRRDDSDGFVFEIKYSITGISTETVGWENAISGHLDGMRYDSLYNPVKSDATSTGLPW